jgi:hypothetical protein
MGTRRLVSSTGVLRRCWFRIPSSGWAAAALALAACAPAPRARPALEGIATLSASRIEVRRTQAQPGLTLVEREGDPDPAAVVAIATGLGPVPNAGLAALLEARLHGAAGEVVAHADGLGVRLELVPADAAAVRRLLGLLHGAASRPVRPGETDALALAGRRLVALRRRALATAPLARLAECSGELGVVLAPAADLSPDWTLGRVPVGAELAERLERWRREALVAERMAVAVVGPATLGAAAGPALAATGPWPRGTPPPARFPAEPLHHAYLAGDAEQGVVRLTLAMRTATAEAAVGVAQELARAPAPLGAKLGALAAPWRLASATAIARPDGGCVRLSLEPSSRARDRALLAREAAVAAAVAWSDVLAPRGPGDRFQVASSILAAGSSAEAGARAAWWALAGAPAAAPPPAPLTSLAVGAVGPERWGDGEEADLDGRYRTAAGQAFHAARLAPVADRRLAVERGQGELWMLVGSACALAHEGAFAAGRSALGAFVAADAGASLAAAADVRLAPVVTPDLVGLVAHATPSSPAERPIALAERVAAVLGAALTRLPLEPASFSRAHASVLAALAQPSARALERVALVALPDEPAWLAPLGVLERQAAASRERVEARWGEILRGPLRLAVLANVDEAQALAAARALDRWLLPDAGARPCPEVGGAGAPTTGTRVVPADGPIGRWWTGALLVAARETEVPLDGRPAEMVAAALDGAGGLLRAAAPTAKSTRAGTVLGPRATWLGVELRAPHAHIAELAPRVLALLERLRTEGLTEAEHRRAVEQVTRARREALRWPEARLMALWRGAATEPPDRAATNAWLARALAPSQRVTIAQTPLADAGAEEP